MGGSENKKAKNKKETNIGLPKAINPQSLHLLFSVRFVILKPRDLLNNFPYGIPNLLLILYLCL